MNEREIKLRLKASKAGVPFGEMFPNFKTAEGTAATSPLARGGVVQHFEIHTPDADSFRKSVFGAAAGLRLSDSIV